MFDDNRSCLRDCLFRSYAPVGPYFHHEFVIICCPSNSRLLNNKIHLLDGAENRINSNHVNRKPFLFMQISRHISFPFLDIHLCLKSSILVQGCNYLFRIENLKRCIFFDIIASDIPRTFYLECGCLISICIHFKSESFDVQYDVNDIFFDTFYC